MFLIARGVRIFPARITVKNYTMFERRQSGGKTGLELFYRGEYLQLK